MRRRLAVLAAVPLLALALTLGAGSASAAPVHQARAYVIQTSQVHDLCWGVDSTVQPQWQGSNPQRAYNTQANSPCATGGLIQFVNYPCLPSPQQGYCALSEVSYDALLGIWSFTGDCIGYSYTLNGLVQQGCGNYSYQIWAGVVQPDGTHLIWSYWLDYYHHNVCPVPGGYTQQVITADTNASQLYLSCPQGQGESYLAKQSWHVDTPIL